MACKEKKKKRQRCGYRHSYKNTLVISLAGLDLQEGCNLHIRREMQITAGEIILVNSSEGEPEKHKHGAQPCAIMHHLSYLEHLPAPKPPTLYRLAGLAYFRNDPSHDLHRITPKYDLFVPLDDQDRYQVCIEVPWGKRAEVSRYSLFHEFK